MIGRQRDLAGTEHITRGYPLVNVIYGLHTATVLRETVAINSGHDDDILNIFIPSSLFLLDSCRAVQDGRTKEQLDSANK